MKNLLIGVAMIFVYMIVLTLSFDSKMYLEQIKEVKLVSKELSATGSLYLDYVDFAQGSVTYNDTESIKAINDQIKSFLQLDSDNTPLEGTYWQDTIHYMNYFYDDTGQCRVYKDGIFHKSFNFTYPYLHEDDLGNYIKTISEPTVITTINTGKPRSRLAMFQEVMNEFKVIKSSSYNWSEYN